MLLPMVKGPFIHHIDILSGFKRLGELALTMSDAPNNLSMVVTAIVVQHSRHSIRPVLSEIASIRVPLSVEQCPLSLSHIQMPFPLVPFTRLLILYLSEPMLLPIYKGPSIYTPISMHPFTLSGNLSIYEITLVPPPIFHEEHTLACFLTTLVLAFVLEIRVFEGVGAFALSELGYGVDVANVSLENDKVIRNAVTSFEVMKSYLPLDFDIFEGDCYCGAKCAPAGGLP